MSNHNETPTKTPRFIKPRVTRLPLTEGDWIDVKRRLNTGEAQDLFARMLPDLITPGEATQLRTRQVLIAKVAAYLVNWSLTDDDGSPVPCDESAINNLDPDTFREIRDAIDVHEKGVGHEVELAKKNLTGAATWNPPSPSAER